MIPHHSAFPLLRLAACVLVLDLFIPDAPAAPVWTVINLHPANATESRLSDTDGSRQAGFARFTGKAHAGLWQGSAGSFVDLHPAGALGPDETFAESLRGTQQAGFAIVNDESVPILWTGSAASAVSLLPNGVTSGSLSDTTGVQQVGSVKLAGTPRAILWNNQAENLVNLHPTTATQSVARTTNGSRQAGYAVIGGISHAALWTGSKESFLDMNPPFASTSVIEEIEETPKADAQMAGYAVIAGQLHAGYWTGLAPNSFVDLNPIIGATSQAVGTDGTHQVGTVWTSGGPRAALWSGSSPSFENLHDLLPSGYSESHAAAVWTDGTTTLVAGWARNTTVSRDEAILWKLAPRPLPTITLRGKTRRITTARRVTVSGGAENATRVEFRTARSQFRPARGVNSWTMSARLARGRNRIFVRALNADGDPSATLQVVIIRK